MKMLVGGLATGVSRLGLFVGIGVIALMVLHITAEVIARSVFGKPLIGTIEVASYFYMVAAAFVPLGYAQDRHDHIEAEVFEGLVPKALRKFTRILGMLLSIVASGLLLYATVNVALRQTRFGEAVMTLMGELPIWPARWLLPLGLAGMIVVMINQLFFRGDIVAHEEPIPSDDELPAGAEPK